jgi:hypothetical protein
MSWEIKGKYPLLNVLLLKFGTEFILRISPTFIEHVIKAMGYASLSTSSSFFLLD